MKAIVVRSPRSLSRPRQLAIVKRTPAVVTVLQGMATAVVRGARGATALAVRATNAAAAHQRQAKWVYATQVEDPDPPPVAPALPAEPRQVKVEKFWDIFD